MDPARSPLVMIVTRSQRENGLDRTLADSSKSKQSELARRATISQIERWSKKELPRESAKFSRFFGHGIVHIFIMPSFVVLGNVFYHGSDRDK